MLAYDTIHQDLIYFIGHKPYDLIFNDSQRNALLFSCMEKIRLAQPLLESLRYFKEYDHYTYRHILMVFALSTLLAQELLNDDRGQIQAALAGPVHDCGKICVPLRILKKTDPLTRTEKGLTSLPSQYDLSVGPSSAK